MTMQLYYENLGQTLADFYFVCRVSGLASGGTKKKSGSVTAKAPAGAQSHLAARAAAISSKAAFAWEGSESARREMRILRILPCSSAR